jgi:hypothetical protein
MRRQSNSAPDRGHVMAKMAPHRKDALRKPVSPYPLAGGGLELILVVGFCGAPLVVRRNDSGGLDWQGDPLGHHGDRPKQAHRDDDGDTDPFAHLHPLCVSG